jgi:hypothetical protein
VTGGFCPDSRNDVGKARSPAVKAASKQGRLGITVYADGGHFPPTSSSSPLISTNGCCCSGEDLLGSSMQDTRTSSTTMLVAITLARSQQSCPVKSSLWFSAEWLVLFSLTKVWMGAFADEDGGSTYPSLFAVAIAGGHEISACIHPAQFDELPSRWCGSVALMWWCHLLWYIQTVAMPLREQRSECGISVARLRQ